jgi:hypothetical protein
LRSSRSLKYLIGKRGTGYGHKPELEQTSALKNHLFFVMAYPSN